MSDSPYLAFGTGTRLLSLRPIKAFRSRYLVG